MEARNGFPLVEAHVRFIVPLAVVLDSVAALQPKVLVARNAGVLLGAVPGVHSVRVSHRRASAHVRAAMKQEKVKTVHG